MRLVEVSSSVGTTNEILPFRFAPEGEKLPYPTVIVVLSPEEKESLQRGELHLPESWQLDLSELKELE